MTAGLALGVKSAGAVTDAALILLLGLMLATQFGSDGVALCDRLRDRRAASAVNAEAVVPDTNVTLFAAGLAAVGYAAITLAMALTLEFRRADATPIAGCGRLPSARREWIAAVGLMMGGLALAA